MDMFGMIYQRMISFIQLMVVSMYSKDLSSFMAPLLHLHLHLQVLLYFLFFIIFVFFFLLV